MRGLHVGVEVGLQSVHAAGLCSKEGGSRGEGELLGRGFGQAIGNTSFSFSFIFSFFFLFYFQLCFQILVSKLVSSFKFKLTTQLNTNMKCNNINYLIPFNYANAQNMTCTHIISF